MLRGEQVAQDLSAGGGVSLDADKARAPVGSLDMGLGQDAADRVGVAVPCRKVLQQPVRLDAGGQFVDAGGAAGLAHIGLARNEPIKRDHLLDRHGVVSSLGSGCQRSVALHPCPSARPGVAEARAAAGEGDHPPVRRGPIRAVLHPRTRSGGKDGETPDAGAPQRAHPCRREGRSP